MTGRRKPERTFTLVPIAFTIPAAVPLRIKAITRWCVQHLPGLLVHLLRHRTPRGLDRARVVERGKDEADGGACGRMKGGVSESDLWRILGECRGREMRIYALLLWS